MRRQRLAEQTRPRYWRNAVNRWMPIETEPTDGTWVPVWRSHGVRPLLARFDQTYETMESEFGDHIYNATHWQHLPEPPND